MKAKLLLIATLISGVSFGQSLTQANEPALGTGQVMYLCDSNANLMDGITGSGVTWDYSTLLGFPTITKNVDILDPLTTPYTDTFPGAQKAIQIENSLTTYFSSTASERTSPGFVYNEPSFGDVVAKFENDPEILVSYPFALGSSLQDTYDGVLYFDFNGLPQTEPCTGVAYAWIDGQGTLQLPGGINYTDVIRYKMIDTSLTNVTLFGDLEIVRVQYEYYDINNNSIPVFTASHIKIQQPGGGMPLTEQIIVLSVVQPPAGAGINENEAFIVNVYPNPAKDQVNASGDFSNDALVQIHDQAGRLMHDGSVNEGPINIAAFDQGMYLLTIIDQGSKVTRTVVKH